MSGPRHTAGTSLFRKKPLKRPANGLTQWKNKTGTHGNNMDHVIHDPKNDEENFMETNGFLRLVDIPPVKWPDVLPHGTQYHDAKTKQWKDGYFGWGRKKAMAELATEHDRTGAQSIRIPTKNRRAPIGIWAACVATDNEKTQKEIMNRLQPYQKAVVTAPKYSAIKGAKKTANESPWRPISELGEIAYMEDGSRKWTLKGDWETMKIFLVYMASGEVQTHYAYIDEDDGYLRGPDGDDVGWLWCDAEYFMDIPARPSLHKVQSD